MWGRETKTRKGYKDLMNRVEATITILLPYLLIAAVAVLRLAVAHPGNFIPLFSCILFFGAMRSRREFALPLVVLMGVDVLLTTRQYGYALTVDHAITWIWYAVVLFLGALAVGTKASPVRAAVAALGSAVGFFVVSNFAVWAIWQMYPHTAAGLATCYVAALPFFRNSFLAEGLASLVLFALPSLVRATLRATGPRVTSY